jgi:hypothetical protein
LTAVFQDVQAMWAQDFAAAGVHYTPAMLTIFRYAVRTACGTQGASVGPLYCPADHGVYLDTRFFNALALHAGVTLGDFAQAYVIAHEVAHHVQLLLGITHRVAAADQSDPAGKNARSVRFELQADCFAGIWMHYSYPRARSRTPTSRMPCAPQPSSATTSSSTGPQARSHRTTGRTARRRSASTGSRSGSSRAGRRPATPSPRRRELKGPPPNDRALPELSCRA